MILELLEEKDYSTIIDFNKGKDADFLYQWAGPGYDFPISEEQIADRIAKGVNGVDSDTYIFKILSKSTNEMIGTIELFKINKEKKTAIIGRFLIKEDSRGKGIGEIALKLLVNKGFEEFALNEIYLYVFDFNISAIKCYEKVGFVKSGFSENVRQVGEKTWGKFEMRIDKRILL